MEGFDSDGPPRRRKPRSSISDENDPAYYGPRPWKTEAKPSGSWNPAKKALGERNGSGDVGWIQTLNLCQSPSKVTESREGVFSLSPSDLSKNSPVPRPEFLRYRPDWRSEVLTCIQDGEYKKEIGGKRNSGQYFCDKEGNNSHGEPEEEVGEGEEEEEEGDVDGSDGRKGPIKKLAWFGLFLLSVSYLYHIDISEVPAEAERINSYVEKVSSWPIHNLTYQAASENISVGMVSLTGEHSVLSGERAPDYGNEMILSKIEEEMLPNFGDDQQPLEFEELSGSLIWDSGFFNDSDGMDMDSLSGEHSVLSGETEPDCGNEEILSKIEEEMWPNFGDDHQPQEFKELAGSVIWDSGIVDDNQENAAVVNGEEVQLNSERGNELPELRKFYSPTTLNLHVDLGKIMDKKLPSSEKHEIPEDEHRKIAWFHRMDMLSLSIPFLIATTLLLGIIFAKRSNFQPQATGESYKGQPIVHSSSNGELQSPRVYPTSPRASAEASSAFYPKHKPAPGVELLGEITFGGHDRSQESIERLISREKKLVDDALWESTFTIKSPSTGRSKFQKQEAIPSHKCRLFHCNHSSNGKSEISTDCTDKDGWSLATPTPTPLRRSSRIRNNRVVQSP